MQAAGKNRNFKQKSTVNFSTTDFSILMSAFKIWGSYGQLFMKFDFGEFCYNLLTQSSFG